MTKALQEINSKWLTEIEGKFMFGNKPSICDVLFACELTQLEGVGHSPDSIKNEYPNIYEWMYGEGGILTFSGYK